MDSNQVRLFITGVMLLGSITFLVIGMNLFKKRKEYGTTGAFLGPLFLFLGILAIGMSVIAYLVIE
jgi:hypothetical protein